MDAKYDVLKPGVQWLILQPKTGISGAHPLFRIHFHFLSFESAIVKKHRMKIESSWPSKIHFEMTILFRAYLPFRKRLTQPVAWRKLYHLARPSLELYFKHFILWTQSFMDIFIHYLYWFDEHLWSSMVGNAKIGRMHYIIVNKTCTYRKPLRNSKFPKPFYSLNDFSVCNNVMCGNKLFISFSM